jgi:hypothetical protein
MLMALASTNYLRHACVRRRRLGIRRPQGELGRTDGEVLSVVSTQSVESCVVVRHSHWYNEIVSRTCCLARKATTVQIWRKHAVLAICLCSFVQADRSFATEAVAGAGTDTCREGESHAKFVCPAPPEKNLRIARACQLHRLLRTYVRYPGLVCTLQQM